MLLITRVLVPTKPAISRNRSSVSVVCTPLQFPEHCKATLAPERAHTVTRATRPTCHRCADDSHSRPQSAKLLF
ncbi:hypothetical protein J6590_046709 [Homalodisca vitripennis]|nr:hypothetical protein J6590_046709 [Homalodisca vitripennis]